MLKVRAGSRSLCSMVAVLVAFSGHLEYLGGRAPCQLEAVTVSPDIQCCSRIDDDEGGGTVHHALLNIAAACLVGHDVVIPLVKG